MTELLENDEWRARFIRYCVECACETMPHSLTGRCNWCDSQLIVRDPKTPKPRISENGIKLCGNGLHEMTEENTSHPGSQRRRCRACMREAWRRSADRKRDAA